jgi:hypothetical protein
MSFSLASLQGKFKTKPNKSKTHSTFLVLTHPTHQNCKPPATKLKTKNKNKNKNQPKP